jgi:hypothetical protein
MRPQLVCIRCINYACVAHANLPTTLITPSRTAASLFDIGAGDLETGNGNSSGNGSGSGNGSNGASFFPATTGGDGPPHKDNRWWKWM